MFINSEFSYDNISGSDMYGLQIIKENSGLFSQNFGMKRKTITDRLKSKRTIDYGTREENLAFDCQFAKETPWTYEQRVEVSKWLFQDFYKDLYSPDYPLTFKCKAIEGEFKNNGVGMGTLNITFECNAPFGFSPIQVSTFDLSNNESSTIIELENRSNIDSLYKPEIQFTIVEGDSIQLENLSRGGEIFGFTDLVQGETIYVDCSKDLIISTYSETRYKNLIDRRFLKLGYGVNRIRVIGKAIIETRMQYPMMV